MAVESLDPRNGPVLEPGHSYGSLSDKLTSMVLTRRTPLAWFIAAGIGFLGLTLFLYSVTMLLVYGIGI